MVLINFDFRDANTVGTVASKGKSKATKAKSKKRDFDLITLSSDEEEEVEEDEEEDEDDEVEFLAEMEGHFFGNQDTDASEVVPNIIAFFVKFNNGFS